MSRQVLMGAIVALALTGCNIEPGCGAGAEPFVSFNALDMDDSPATEAQEGAAAPQPGTVHRAQFVYPFAKFDRTQAGDALQNPLPLTHENLMLGQRKFDTYCAVCHGKDGLGPASETRSEATNRGVMPGNTLVDARMYKLAQERPGEIFHVITKGSAIMGSYASQLEPLERWAVVHWMRTLGRVQNPGN
jgi:mono/diheme cytochrome c family protein